MFSFFMEIAVNRNSGQIFQKTQKLTPVFAIFESLTPIFKEIKK